MIPTRLMAPALIALLAAGPALAQTMPESSAPAASTPASQPPPMVGGTPQPSGASTSGEEPMSPSAVSGAFTKITPTAGANIVAELQASGEFTILLKALAATNLTTLLQTRPGLTLLAPTDAAFQALPPGELTTLMAPASAAKLQSLLTYHLINATVALNQIQNHAAGPVNTVNGKPVTIDGSGATIKINDANVLQAAVPASNGLIYVIDKVLTPPA